MSLSAIKRGPLGQHMYDLQLNDFLTHDFIIVGLLPIPKCRASCSYKLLLALFYHRLHLFVCPLVS